MRKKNTTRRRARFRELRTLLCSLSASFSRELPSSQKTQSPPVPPQASIHYYLQNPAPLDTHSCAPILPHLPDHSSSSANSHLAPGAASMPQDHHRASPHSPRSQLSSPHTLDQTAHAYAH